MRDLPFFLIACMVHGAVLSTNPVLQWGAAAQKAEKSIAVDFVTALPPAPTPTLAPVPPGEGKTALTQEPGPSESEQSKEPKKKSRIARMSPARKAALARQKAQAQSRAQALKAARAQALRIRREKLEATRAAATQLAAERAAQARERARLLAQERAERARRIAQEKAERVRKRVEIAQQLAALADPDEELSDAPNDPPTGSSPGGNPKTAGQDAALAQAEESSLKDAPEPVYENEREGQAAAGALAPGNGAGPGGTSWSLEGPVGNRRLLRRVLPRSPDWVSRRGLELSVQIKFQVLADGTVKPGAVIKKTSGFPEIDRLALEALRLWKFAAAGRKGGAPETWGSVTFRFLMG